jgi:hypothetical protein
MTLVYLNGVQQKQKKSGITKITYKIDIDQAIITPL